MNASSLRDGDLIEVTVTRSLPFGVLVTTAGQVPGLVRGVTAEVGDVVRIRVDEYDEVEHRFSGRLR